jgi:primary-amine oxidase
LPENALTLDAVLADESLNSKTYANRVFFYERDGGALFAHTQKTDDSRVYARAKELVVGFVATIGNYDYIFKWVFRQDGSFGFEAELQGLILNKTADLGNCQDCATQLEGGPGTYKRSGDAKFGTLVSPNIMGIFHQHWINLRLDFDIDGQVNAVKECNTTLLGPDPATNPCGRAFTVEDTIFATATEAERMLNLESNRVWLVYNPAKRIPTGEFEGYEIDPLENTTSVIPESRSEKSASFTQRHFWVTQYHANELYAAGKYPNQAPPDSKDDLYHYAQRDESIYNQDIVVWYSLGFTHITKPEDYPIMPGGRIAVNFVPRGFFTKSPALGYATIEKVRLHH